jgi:hypothetical protein
VNFASVTRMPAATRTVKMRFSRYDWNALSEEINGYGCAVIEKLLSPEECRQIAGLFRRKAISAVTSTWRGMASAKASTAISNIRCPI